MSSVIIQKYNYDLRSDRFSESEQTVLTLEYKHFAAGGMRLAYKGTDHKTGQLIVVKRNIQGENSFTAAKMNVQTQERCMLLAEIFNKQPQVVKKVLFTRLVAIQILSGPWSGQYGTIEKYLEGQFVKHNSNIHLYGEDFALTDRSTPQAFSHFTLQHSNYKELVCDIQGVDDEYTDPQVHTMELNPQYGPGNWGWKGIWIFLAYHRCNDICKALKLTVRQMKPVTELPGTQVCDQYRTRATD